MDIMRKTFTNNFFSNGLTLTFISTMPYALLFQTINYFQTTYNKIRVHLDSESWNEIFQKRIVQPANTKGH